MVKKLFFLTLLLCGCASQKNSLTRLYPGPEQPASELAILSIREPVPGILEGQDGPLWIREWDEKTCYAGTIATLPGKHVASLMFTKRFRTREGSVKIINRGYLRLHVETKAGHIYLLHTRVVDDKTAKVYGIDVTGKVDLSPQGTILFPESFQKYWSERVKPEDDSKAKAVFKNWVTPL